MISVTVAVEETGPVEDVPIGNEFSHINDKPLTIDDFELLKVFELYHIFVFTILIEPV